MSISPITAFLLVIFTCFAAVACASDTTVIFVRHAERATGQDPDLTPAGQQRAQALVGVVRRAGVGAIYVTPFQRTRQTAAPAAQVLGLTPNIFPIDATPEAHAAALADDIMEHHAGGRVLVVGHTNTIPLIMERLGVSNPPQIAETEFDRLFIVIKRKNDPARLIEAKYGP